MSSDYLEATQRELEQWPGVTMRSAVAGKHRLITLHYNGRSRKVFASLTPSDDSHGLKNHLGVVRKELAALGAQKEVRKVGKERRRTRNKPQRPPVWLLGRARPFNKPFASLAGLLKQVDA